MRRTLVLGAGLAVACSAATDDMGDVMEDGGQWLVDAGTDMRDSAQAQAPASGESQVETSGSRLEARYTTVTHVGADGAMLATRKFDGWRDVARNEVCMARALPDGKTRCMPLTHQGGILFADAACSRVLLSDAESVTTTASAPPPLYIVGRTADASGDTGPLRIFKVGNPVTPQIAYTMSAASVCAQLPSSILNILTSQRRSYEAGEEVALTDFVEFTITTSTE